MKIRTLLITIIACMAAIMLGVGASALLGMSRMEASLKTVYEDRIVALNQLRDIEVLTLESRLTIARALASPTTDMISASSAEIEKNIAQIDRLWGAFMDTFLTPEEKSLAAQFANDRKKLIDQGFVPAMAALRANDFEKTRQIVTEIIRPMIKFARDDINALGALQLSVTKEEYEDARSFYFKFEYIALAVSIIGLAFVMWLGLLLIRDISMPIERVLRFTQAVLSGDFSQKIDVSSNDEIGKLTKAIMKIHDHLVKALGEAYGSQMRVETILDNVDEPIIVFGNGCRIEIFNPAAEQVFGYTEEEMIGQDVNVLLLGKNECRLTDPPEQHLELTNHFDFVGSHESVGVRKDCSRFPMEIKTRKFHYGQESLVLVMAKDLTNDKQSTVMQVLLLEKEALLKEVHHRVKNNLQIIASMLKLESRNSEHEPTMGVLDNMHGRIRSMALLHESLYRSGMFANVDLGAYLKQLSTQIIRSLSIQDGSIKLHLDLASVQVGVDQALPCGLLINELFSNSLKHGFPDGRVGEIRIELHPMNDGPQWQLRVSDTGVGLPDDFASKQGHSIGLQLVSDLARQLGGCLEIEPGAATTFAVKFVPARG
jgi:PAS domain S-box-containing protein